MIFSLFAMLVATQCAKAAELQQAIERAMAGRSGSAVIARVDDGKVLASVNLRGAGRRRALPGSTVKPLVLRALIERGLDGRRTVICDRKLRIGTHDLACGHPQVPALNGATAIAYSCNTYFAQMSAELKPEELRSALLASGIASPSGVSAGEASGTVTLARTVEELQLQSLGEANMAITPLGLLSAYRRLAIERAKADPKYVPVYEGLDSATQYGMSRLAASGLIRVAGKTGTSLSEGHWTHAWFTGFAPADKPEVVVVVFLERGSGPADAAPIAKQIFDAYARTKR
jgi:cell division protein FtsI/penicillin-binding protein 2